MKYEIAAAAIAVIVPALFVRFKSRIPDFWKSEVAPTVIAMSFLLFSVGFIMSLKPSSDLLGADDDYREAAENARWPDPSHVSADLVGFKFDHPVTVVTWMQKRWVPSYQHPDPVTVARDVWVTVAPYLRKFCQEYRRSHGADSDQLALRLKERLGLPPEADSDTFVELIVDPKDRSRLFRPCSDSRLEATSCKVPSLPAASDEWSNPSVSPQQQDQEKEWLLRNYYSTYATEKPYPWTALGYTFDWARKTDSNDFERLGESEFVIPKGDLVHFVSATSTVAYCTP